jgi:hypothetical protein
MPVGAALARDNEGTCLPPLWAPRAGKERRGPGRTAVSWTTPANGKPVQPEQERSAPQVVSEPDPPYDSDKQQRPGLEADMRTAP